jgi:hypothetical protein
MTLPRILFAIAPLLLVAPPSEAQDELPASDPQAEVLARQAAQIRDKHCTGVAGQNTTLAAKAFTPVSEVWGRVSYHYEKNGTIYLRYWRGVLEDCLSQDERALEDLKGFVAVTGDKPLWSSLVYDAQQRIRRISGVAPGVAPAKARLPLPLLGIGLGVASGALAVGAGVSWNRSQVIVEDQIYPLGTTGQDLADAYKDAQTSARTSYALTGVAVGCGIGSVIALVMSASQRGASRGAGISPPVLVPSEAGAIVHWEGRW